MSPVYSVNYSREGCIRNSINLRQFALSNISLVKFFSNFGYLLFCKFRTSMTASMINTQKSMLKSMNRIFISSNIFKIGDSRIILFPVFMVALESVWFLTKKCFCHQKMNIMIFLDSVFMQTNYKISIGSNYIFKNSPRSVPSYFSRIRNVIISFISDNWFPCFHLYLQIKEAAFGGLQETVKFLHLLTAELGTKNPFPVSKYSITKNLNLSTGEF